MPKLLNIYLSDTTFLLSEEEITNSQQPRVLLLCQGNIA
jgi:hypothetical protein